MEKLTKEIDDELNFLDKANDEQICEYLKNLKSKNSYNLEYHPKIKKVFTKIFNNKNKIVQIALVKFYPGSELAERFLLESKDKELRKECLKKKVSFGPLFSVLGLYKKKDIIQFLKKASDEELYIYFTRDNINLMTVKQIFERDEDKHSMFVKISDKLYRNIVLILEDNPNMHKEPDSLSDEYDFEWGGMSCYEDKKTYEKFHKELKIIKKLRNLE